MVGAIRQWLSHHSIPPCAVPSLPTALGFESAAGQVQQVAERGGCSLPWAHPQHLTHTCPVGNGKGLQGQQLLISGCEPLPSIQPGSQANGIGSGHLRANRLAA